jgi:methyl-accepting chemotaxis protein
VGEISSASDEQAAGAAQIGEAVTEMDQVTQQNASLVEEMAAAASSLKAQAHDLVEVVAVFELDTHSSINGNLKPQAVASMASAGKTVVDYKSNTRHSMVRTSPQLKPPAPKAASLPKLTSTSQSNSSGNNNEWESF